MKKLKMRWSFRKEDWMCDIRVCAQRGRAMVYYKEWLK